MSVPSNSVPAEAPAAYLPHVAKGAIINLAGAGGRMFILYLYTLMLARILTVSQLGTYFLMFTIITILGLVSTAGLDSGVVRYIALNAGEGQYGSARKILKVGLLAGIPVGLVSAALLIVFAPRLGELLFDNDLTAVRGLRIFALAIPFWVTARLLNAATQGFHKMQYQVYSRDLGEQLSKLILSSVAIVLGLGLLGVIWANVAALVIAMLLSAFFVVSVFSSSKSDAAGAERPAKGMILYFLPLALSHVIGMILLWVDLLLLGYFGNSSDVGIYGAALRIGVASSTIVLAFGTVFNPVISDLCKRNDIRQLSNLLKTVTRWIFICCYPIFLVAFFFAEPIMRIFGHEYAANSSVLMILATGQMINVVLGSSGFIIVMSGRSHLELLNIASALIVNITLCFLLIPRYGANGAALANMTSMIVVNIMRASELWIIMRIHAYDRSYLKPLLAGGVGALVTVSAGRFTIENAGLLQTLVLITSFLAIFVLTMLAMGLNEQDKTILRLVKVRMRREPSS